MLGVVVVSLSFSSFEIPMILYKKIKFNESISLTREIGADFL